MSAARPEIAQCVLIHLCTRPREVLPHEWVERLAAEDQSERLLQTAERTRIGGLVWSMLTPEQRALLPSECSDALQGIHLSNALRWQACRKLLVDSAESLAAHGIPVIALKGAALLLRGVYPDPGQRAIADLDLLVPEEHLAAAHAILSGAAAHVAALHPDRHLATIYLPGEAGTIEVHGAADHAARWPQTDDPFSAAEVTTVDGAAVLLPDDANLWLHLAAHGLSHPPDYWPRTSPACRRSPAGMKPAGGRSGGLHSAGDSSEPCCLRPRWRMLARSRRDCAPLALLVSTAIGSPRRRVRRGASPPRLRTAASGHGRGAGRVRMRAGGVSCSATCSLRWSARHTGWACRCRSSRLCIPSTSCPAPHEPSRAVLGGGRRCGRAACARC